VNMATDQNRAALIELAEGRLAPAQRRELVLRALRDPQLAVDMQLALRLADGGAELARDWIALATRPAAAERSEWWRPLAGVTASLAIIAAVMTMPRLPQTDPGVASSVAQMQQSLPDRIGAASFEASSDLFGGSFEAD